MQVIVRTIAKSIMDRISIEYKTYEGNDGESLYLNGVKTVVIVPGVSTKGLGEAGIKIDEKSVLVCTTEMISDEDIEQMSDQFMDIMSGEEFDEDSDFSQGGAPVFPFLNNICN